MPLHEGPLKFWGSCNKHVIFHVMACNRLCNRIHYIRHYIIHYTRHYTQLHAILHALQWGYMLCYIHITHWITWPVTQLITWIITNDYTSANCGGCTRCIGMYWDVFWMYQIKFGCINIPIHHRCIGMYFRGIVMYYKMYWDLFHNVLRCITILFMLTKYMPIHRGIQHNTSCNTSQYL